ncbi:MAG TPA: thrombospondin type 3 repeat-containing protein, partial [Verrucomicrobiae bacterium]|nr:thrombospondin type 3 repeat-containing protein [Verrucomicrobiae bacterium]
DASADPDGDGFSNLQEYQAGTDPNDPNSNPDINSWKSLGSDKWEAGSNWVLGVAPASSQAVYITNAASKTVTVDGTTVLSNALNGCLSVSNLSVTAPLGSTNTLRLSDTAAGTLAVLNNLTVGLNGELSVSNSNLRVDGAAGGNLVIDGAVVLQSGTIEAASNLATTVIGNVGSGSLTLNGGTALLREVEVGNGVGTVGTLSVAGGTGSVYSAMTLGDLGCTATGIVNVTAGSLLVTNAVGGAVLEVRSGLFEVSGGAVTIDQLVVTNACARFLHSGGTLSITATNLDPNLDADGDGIPNGWEQSHGLDPFNPADASADPDGDGFNNLQEYQAGTDPNDPGSRPLRVTSIAVEGSNVVIMWTTLGGTTNQVEVTAGDVDGAYSTNGFSNLGAQMLIDGSGVVTTNYTDTNGATNAPSRFYRVRLVP